jgi:hypothetical protein
MTEVEVTNPNPVFLSPAEQAEALAYALAQLGFSTEVWKSRNYQLHPCVAVKCGPYIHLRQPEYVFAAPNLHDGGEWWWWRASPDDPTVLEQVTPISQISAAADLLARTFPQIRDGSNGD